MVIFVSLAPIQPRQQFILPDNKYMASASQVGLLIAITIPKTNGQTELTSRGGWLHIKIVYLFANSH